MHAHNYKDCNNKHYSIPVVSLLYTTQKNWQDLEIHSPESVAQYLVTRCIIRKFGHTAWMHISRAHLSALALLRAFLLHGASMHVH